MLAREYKKFGIVPSRKPQVGFPVAGVVQVVGKEGPGYVNIRFAEALVDAVGKAMPYGVSDATPCYLKATRLPTGMWRISAHYLGRKEGCVLWESAKPSWIKKVHKGESNGAYSEAAQAAN